MVFNAAISLAACSPKILSNFNPKISYLAVFSSSPIDPKRSPNIDLPPTKKLVSVPTISLPFAKYVKNPAAATLAIFIELGIADNDSNISFDAFKPVLNIGNAILPNINCNSAAAAFVCSSCFEYVFINSRLRLSAEPLEFVLSFTASSASCQLSIITSNALY